MRDLTLDAAMFKYGEMVREEAAQEFKREVWRNQTDAIDALPEVLDCLVFLHNTNGRFPSFNVINFLPEPLRSHVAAEAARRVEIEIVGRS